MCMNATKGGGAKKMTRKYILNIKISINTQQYSFILY